MTASYMGKFKKHLSTFGILAATWAGCATAGPFVADASGKRQSGSATEGGVADEVFLRAPWELWRMPNGSGRYHRGALMLLPDKMESFQIGEISVYQPDGSDVRVDYYSVDFGGGSQSHESISVFVYPAPRNVESDWKSAIDRMTRKWPGSTAAPAFPIPKHHPDDTRQVAWVAPARSGDPSDSTFVQVTLFQEGAWAVRYEISCPASDVGVTREKTRAFLRSIRAKEWSTRTK